MVEENGGSRENYHPSVNHGQNLSHRLYFTWYRWELTHKTSMEIGTD